MAEIGQDVDKARALLMAGEVVAIPTETVYGLAANALDEAAILKIFQAKNRPHFDPLIVHVHSFDQAKQYTEAISKEAATLAERFWPGALTLLLPKKKQIPDLVTSGLNTVGMRCPNHPLALNLLRQLPFPLAAPSANPFGYVSPTAPKHVNDQLGDQVAYILDGGVCSVGIESTIVGFENNRGVIYRMGGISQESIESVIGTVTTQLTSSSNPKAPGQLLSHYAPKKKLLVGQLGELIKQNINPNVGIIAFRQKRDEVESKNQRVLSRSGNLEEAARNLFAVLREMDTMNVDLIFAEPVPNIGLGKAINDRLKRASVIQ